MATLRMTRPAPTEKELRDCGYTASALRFPLSEFAVRILCFENGIAFEKAPPAWHFAPNEACRDRLESLTKSPIYKAFLEPSEKNATVNESPWAWHFEKKSVSKVESQVDAEKANLKDDDLVLVGPGTRQCLLCDEIVESTYVFRENIGHKKTCKHYIEQEPKSEYARELSPDEIDALLGFAIPGHKDVEFVSPSKEATSDFPGPVIVIDKWRYRHVPFGEKFEKCNCTKMCDNEKSCPYGEYKS